MGANGYGRNYERADIISLKITFDKCFSNKRKKKPKTA